MASAWDDLEPCVGHRGDDALGECNRDGRVRFAVDDKRRMLHPVRGDEPAVSNRVRPPRSR